MKFPVKFGPEAEVQAQAVLFLRRNVKWTKTDLLDEIAIADQIAIAEAKAEEETVLAVQVDQAVVVHHPQVVHQGVQAQVRVPLDPDLGIRKVSLYFFKNGTEITLST